MKRSVAVTWASALLVITCLASADGAPRAKSKSSKATPGVVDPNAKKIDVFKAVDDRQVQMQVLAQGIGSAILTLTNSSEEPLNIEVPLALAAVPQVLKGMTAPQSLAVAVNPQWAAGVDKKARKTNVKMNKKPKAGDDDAKDEKKAGDKKDEEKDKEEKKGDSLVALVPLLPGATQQLPLFTLGLETPDKKLSPVAGAPYGLAELDKVTQAPEMKKLLEQYVQGKIPQNTAQILAWHYHGRLGWDQMASAGLAVGAPLEVAKQFAEIVEGRASAESAPQTTSKKKKR